MPGTLARPIFRRPQFTLHRSNLLDAPEPLRLVAVVAIAAIGGVMNAIAGGGTLLTFPALVGLGIPAIVANATSTVALWPGAVASMWGYRGELAGAGRWALGFALPSLLGGVVGAWLLVLTPADRFDAIVPWLILGATALFIVQQPVMSALRRRRATRDGVPNVAFGDDTERTKHFPPPTLLLFQVGVAVYGGYFGAGVGILMLAALGMMGLTNIHRMNGLKNWGGMCMNLVAAAMFAFEGLVSWPVALAMASGAMLGGYAGSRLAQRVGQRWVRVGIVGIGVGSGIWLMVR